MSKALEKSGEMILDKVLQYAQAAESFVVENAPQYVREFLEYEAWYHQQWVYWGFVPFLILFALACLLACLCDKDSEAIPGIFVGSAFFLFLAIMTVPHSYAKLHKIKIAPRVYIIDSLRKK